MAKATRDGHPDHDFSAVTQRGLKVVAVAVARTHQAAVEPRLPAGMLGGLTADLQQLEVEVAGALGIRSGARTATTNQNEAPARGDLLVTAIWTSVLRRGAAGDVQLGMGWGEGPSGTKGRTGRSNWVRLFYDGRKSRKSPLFDDAKARLRDRIRHEPVGVT